MNRPPEARQGGAGLNQQLPGIGARRGQALTAIPAVTESFPLMFILEKQIERTAM